MLFNSYIYMLLFLPATVAVYFFLNRKKYTLAAKGWLLLCSLVFYSWWDIRLLPLLLFSILFNYMIGTALSKEVGHHASYQRAIFIIGIAVNVLLLGFFKYANFTIDIANLVLSQRADHLKIVLPLAISFFTFTQIAYLFDSYKGRTKEYDLLNYALFVTYFPHLIAGPIVHHRQLIPQFQALRNKVVDYRNLSAGTYLFVIGLFKKTVIADTLASYASQGFGTAGNLSFLDAWLATLSYTFQIYFDFSGYMDMACGAAMMMNIKLPANFNSPYKASSIQDFWRRWHITLSAFLKDHIYIPLGGNRGREHSTLLNLLITFLAGGIWHGAGWTFIMWGGLHGSAMIACRLWRRVGIELHAFAGWLLTFVFVCISWVFFRAENYADAIAIVKSLCGLNGFSLRTSLGDHINFLELFPLPKGFTGGEVYWLLGTLLALSVFFRNSNEMARTFVPNRRNLVFIALLGVAIWINMDATSEFLYFNF